MLAVSTDQVREAIRSVLEHDRWNSNLTDDHIAEKVTALLKQVTGSGPKP